MHVLSPKLRYLKPVLKKWNKDTFGNISLKVTQTNDEVNKIESLINYACYNDDIGSEGKIVNFY